LAVFGLNVVDRLNVIMVADAPLEMLTLEPGPPPEYVQTAFSEQLMLIDATSVPLSLSPFGEPADVPPAGVNVT
jgi:hypothetical protein